MEQGQLLQVVGTFSAVGCGLSHRSSCKLTREAGLEALRHQLRVLAICGGASVSVAEIATYAHAGAVRRFWRAHSAKRSA